MRDGREPAPCWPGRTKWRWREARPVTWPWAVAALALERVAQEPAVADEDRLVEPVLGGPRLLRRLRQLALPRGEGIARNRARQEERDERNRKENEDQPHEPTENIPCHRASPAGGGPR